MGKKKKQEEPRGLLTKEQQKKLQDMANEMLEIAAGVIDEYEDLDLSELSELSSSITQIHEDSPYLDDIFKGDAWKTVIKNIPPIPKVSDDEKTDDTE